ncbi:MAG TPA: hypothetical protein VGD15_26835, partial [Kribbella sp.]
NPATFPQTRFERLKAKMGRRIRAKSQAPGSDEFRIARIADRDHRLVEIRKWAEDQLHGDIEAGPGQLSEINMWVMGRAEHLGVLHGKVAKAYYAQNTNRLNELQKE